MDAAELRATQAPIKDRYKSDPGAAMITLKAKGSIDQDGIACKVETGRALAIAGLHPATGGSGLELCSGDMLLEALVACAGVTLKSVATDFSVTPAQATSASSSMSPEHSSSPEPPVAGCKPATANARPVSTLQAMPSFSIEPLALSVIIAAFGSVL